MKPMLPIKTKDGVKERHIEVEEEEEEPEEEVSRSIHQRSYLYAIRNDVGCVITLNGIMSITCHYSWPE